MRTIPYRDPVPLMLGAIEGFPPESTPVWEPDLSRVRPVINALKALPDIRREEVAHICALLVQRIAGNTWVWADGDDVMQRLAEIHDQLECME